MRDSVLTVVKFVVATSLVCCSVIVSASQAVANNRRAYAQTPVPSWLKASELQTLRTVFDGATPVHIDYIAYPKKIAVIFAFSHVIYCGVCSSPIGAALPHGRVAGVSFDKKTHLSGYGSNSWGMRFCEVDGNIPPKQACLKR
jgi:hypothetical protein